MKRSLKQMAGVVVLTFLAMFILSVGLASADTGGKLIAEYKFNGDFNDSSGNGNNGTKIGDVSFVNDSTMGQCAVFNGGYLDVNSTPALNLGSQFSISAWVMVDPGQDTNNSEGTIISKLDADGNYDNYNVMTEGTYGARMYAQFNKNGETNITSSGISDMGLSGTWSHLVFSYDGQTLYLYQNGALIGTQEVPGDSLIPSGSKVRLGCGNDINKKDYFYKGKMADLRIYNYSLSSDEIKSISNSPGQYASTVASTPPTVTSSTPSTPAAAASGLIAEYTFNGDFKDASGNGNDGTKIGDVSFANDSTAGPCAVFNGGYLNVNSTPALNLGSQFSISAWVMVDPAQESGNSEGTIISKLDSDGSYDDYNVYTQGTHGATLYGQFKNNGETKLFNGPGDMGLSGTWSHLVFSYDGQTLYLYQNGSLIGTQEVPGDALIPSASKVRIGCGNDINKDDYFYKGKMADLRIYNYCLSSDEIKTITSSPGKWASSTNSSSTAAGNGTIVLTVGQPTMMVNGASRDIDPGQGTASLIVNGRVFVPIGAIVKAMGGSVGWSGATQQVTINRQATVINLQIGNDSATVNGQPATLDVVPYISNTGRTMLPLGFVTKNLGCQVKWDGNTYQVTINF